LSMRDVDESAAEVGWIHSDGTSHIE
jgi:hypothetical protein